MTKSNDIEKQIYQARREYINRSWKDWYESWRSGLSRITNYLFVLNTGALLVALTYIATNPPNSNIKISIFLFAAGIVFSLLHAGIDYYLL